MGRKGQFIDRKTRIMIVREYNEDVLTLKEIAEKYDVPLGSMGRILHVARHAKGGYRYLKRVLVTRDPENIFREHKARFTTRDFVATLFIKGWHEGMEFEIEGEIVKIDSEGVASTDDGRIIEPNKNGRLKWLED